MSTHFTIDDPLEVAAAASALRARAERFRHEIRTVMNEIDQIAAERPWGNDRYGQAFEQNGHDIVPPGWDTTLRAAIQDGTEAAGTRLEEVSGRAVSGITAILSVDGQNAADLTATADQ